MDNPFVIILEEINELKSLIQNKEQKKEEKKKYIKGIHALAEFLDVAPSTAQRLKNSGTIPYRQYGRLVLFDADEVIESIEEHKKK